MSVAQPLVEDSNFKLKRVRIEIQLALSFTDEDKVDTIQPHNVALVVTLKIGGYDAKRVLVDQGCGAEIMYLDLYNELNLKPKDLTIYDSPLLGFDGKVVIPRGQIRLLVQAGSEVVEVDFIVVDAYSHYTAIVVRPWLHALGAVSSTLHLKVKYPSRDQIEELAGSQFVARQCLAVRAQLPPWEKEELIVFLKGNIDVFIWNAYEALGVDSNFIYHHLNVNPSIIPRKQPHWRLSKEHSNVVRDEAIKLKQVRAIKEVFYPEWLANTVVVKKKNGKWQGYHQIPLALGDQEKTTFVTPIGNVPLQVVKSKVVSEHIEDLSNIFGILRKYKMRLNASKCSFGVGSRKFLGYMITHCGIEVNPDQIKEINSLQPP
ncbi:uncharacterized protein LOC136071216 [Quercus suber]|uniref:uncharacterized protein LOC136071216 n=1 Tax=Quercus suber TaxID=58331 RepID=UPI0032DF49F6